MGRGKTVIIQRKDNGSIMRQHFAWSKMRLNNAPADKFYRSQWSSIPEPVYIAYRVVLAVYFLTWYILSATQGGGVIQPSEDGESIFSDIVEPIHSIAPVAAGQGNSTSPKLPHHDNVYQSWWFCVFLTNWSFTVFNLYLIIAAVNVSLHYFRNRQRETVPLPSAGLPFLCKTHWLFYSLQVGLNVMVCIGFWSLLYPFSQTTRDGTGFVSVHVHLINGVVTLVDIFIVAIPVNLLHAVYTHFFLTSYIIFSLIFWVAGGEPFPIYGFLDYEKRPTMTAGLIIGMALVMVPLMWLGVYGLTRLRIRLSRRCTLFEEDSAARPRRSLDMDVIQTVCKEGLI